MKIYLSLFVILFLSACGGEKDDSEDVIFDPNVEAYRPTNLYQPNLQTSWQWQLSGVVNSSYDVDLYDIDLFDSTQELIDSLHDKGKHVICYFSAGSYENWRSDEGDFPPSTLGNNLDGWVDEKWLDISQESLAPVMRARLDLAVEKGCDGVEPDNMDGYTNSSGFALSFDDQLSYNKFIANEARMRGLSVALKNDLNQIVELEPYFDFAVNEQCHVYNECDMLQPFIDAFKPVFNAEYSSKYKNNTDGARDVMCADSKSLGLRTLVLPMNLDDRFRYSCD